MKGLVFGWLVMLALLVGAASASAAIVLAPGSTWEYTFINPTGDSSWNKTTGGWSTGPAPFGNWSSGWGNNSWGGTYHPFTHDFDFATFWPRDSSYADDLWVRTAVDFTGFDLSTAKWDLGVDNGYSLYINGVLIASGGDESYTWRWEYSGALSPNPGVNIVAVALNDWGGETAFDMQITADATVPEPCSLLVWSLLGASGVGLGWWRRRPSA